MGEILPNIQVFKSKEYFKLMKSAHFNIYLQKASQHIMMEKTHTVSQGCIQSMASLAKKSKAVGEIKDLSLRPRTAAASLITDLDGLMI